MLGGCAQLAENTNRQMRLLIDLQIAHQSEHGEANATRLIRASTVTKRNTRDFFGLFANKPWNKISDTMFKI